MSKNLFIFLLLIQSSLMCMQEQQSNQKPSAKNGGSPQKVTLALMSGKTKRNSKLNFPLNEEEKLSLMILGDRLLSFGK